MVAPYPDNHDGKLPRRLKTLDTVITKAPGDAYPTKEEDI